MIDVGIEGLRARCRAILEEAAAEARALEHPYLGVEHVFLALTRAPEPRLEEALGSIGLDGARARALVRKAAGRGKGAASSAAPPITPRLARILGAAADRTGGDAPPAPGALLEAMLEEGTSLPVRCLAASGLEPARWARDGTAGYGEAERTRFAAEADAPLGAAEDPCEPRPQAPGPAPEPGPRIVPEDPVPRSAATPALDRYGRDLTRLARLGKLSDAVGRDAELEQIVTILSRTQKANPVLLGEAGVGKTAIVEGLAWRIAHGSVPAVMRHRRIVDLDMGALTAGTDLRGQLERRIKEIVREATEAPDVVLFIDELHTIVGDAVLDAAQLLKPALAHGDFSCIGATTQDEYYRYIRRDPALERRFSPVMVREPTREATLAVLERVAARILDRHAGAGHPLTLSPDAVMAAARLTDQYVRDRQQPDKAIDALDQACARAVVKGLHAVGAADVALAVSEWTGVPVARMTEDEQQRLARIGEHLDARVVGQRDATAAVGRAVLGVSLGAKAPERPAIFLFVGPRGVGKTRLAHELARFLFQSERSLVRFDMSEFRAAHTAAKLLGAPRGCLGSERGGLLGEALRQQPYSLVLLEDANEAHPDVLDLLSSVFDEGGLCDAQGRVVDCSHALFVLTCRTDALRRGGPAGFTAPGSDPALPRRAADLREAAAGLLGAELVQQITEVVPFSPLKREHLGAIIDLLLEPRLEELSLAQQARISLALDAAARELIVDRGCQLDMGAGARPLERAVEQHLLQPLTAALRAGVVAAGPIRVSAEQDRLAFMALAPDEHPEDDPDGDPDDVDDLDDSNDEDRGDAD